MNINFLNLKLILGTTYLVIISIGLYFLFSIIDIKDLMSYEFIRLNKDIILKYKNENFLFLTIIFFIFSIFWVLLLGFVMPLLIFSGFVFGKWWGILLVLTSTTIGSAMLYTLVGFFFRDLIKQKFPNFTVNPDIIPKGICINGAVVWKEEYKNLISLVGTYLPIVDFSDVYTTDTIPKFCVLRHDIEFSIDRAYQLAKVEKELGITKEDIGKNISIEDYNKACRKDVMKYKGEWEKLTNEMGYWVDMDKPYLTYDNKYIG